MSSVQQEKNLGFRVREIQALIKIWLWIYWEISRTKRIKKHNKAYIIILSLDNE